MTNKFLKTSLRIILLAMAFCLPVSAQAMQRLVSRAAGTALRAARPVTQITAKAGAQVAAKVVRPTNTLSQRAFSCASMRSFSPRPLSSGTFGKAALATGLLAGSLSGNQAWAQEISDSQNKSMEETKESKRTTAKEWLITGGKVVAGGILVVVGGLVFWRYLENHNYVGGAATQQQQQSQSSQQSQQFHQTQSQSSQHSHLASQQHFGSQQQSQAGSVQSASSSIVSNGASGASSIISHIDSDSISNIASSPSSAKYKSAAQAGGVQYHQNQQSYAPPSSYQHHVSAQSVSAGAPSAVYVNIMSGARTHEEAVNRAVAAISTHLANPGFHEVRSQNEAEGGIVLQAAHIALHRWNSSRSQSQPRKLKVRLAEGEEVWIS